MSNIFCISFEKYLWGGKPPQSYAWDAFLSSIAIQLFESKIVITNEITTLKISISSVHSPKQLINLITN